MHVVLYAGRKTVVVVIVVISADHFSFVLHAYQTCEEFALMVCGLCSLKLNAWNRKIPETNKT